MFGKEYIDDAGADLDADIDDDSDDEDGYGNYIGEDS